MGSRRIETMKEEIPQKIGAFSATAFFFLILFVSLYHSVSIFNALLYAVYSFFLILIVGWLVGTLIIYKKEEETDKSIIQTNLLNESKGSEEDLSSEDFGGTNSAEIT